MSTSHKAMVLSVEQVTRLLKWLFVCCSNSENVVCVLQQRWIGCLCVVAMVKKFFVNDF